MRKALDKEKLRKEIRREEKRARRIRKRELRAEILAVKAAKKAALLNAKVFCRQEREAAKVRARELRVVLLNELRERVKAERWKARSACSARIQEGRALGSRERAAREALRAETELAQELRRLERIYARERVKVSARVRASESDDEVRQNIAPELVPLFERVKRGIKATARASRTEVFLKYAEEHPKEVLEGIDERTDALIAELEARAAAERVEEEAPF